VPASPRQAQRQLSKARRATVLALALLGLGAGLAGCGPSAEQKRQEAERLRQERQAQAELQRCRRDQKAISELTGQIQGQTKELAKLNAERYEASPRPEPPSPALAARFTQEDRELDELRYRERLRNWEVLEQQRYGHWIDEQQNRRDRLRGQLQTNGTLLRRIAPELMAEAGGSALNAEAVARATRCNPADFGLQDSAPAGSSSRAAAN